MQISAINNNVGFGKSHARKAREAAIQYQENAILALRDKDISDIAQETAKIQTNDKKHQRITTGLIASVPLLFGLSDAVMSKGMDGKTVAKELAENSPKGLTTKFFKTIGKNLNGAAARTAVGLAGALSLAGFFAIVDGAVVAKRQAAKHSEGFKNFENKHPGTTLIGTIGAALVATHYIPKGIASLVDNISKEKVVKAMRKTTKFGESFNKNSIVSSLASGAEKLAQNAPSSVKSVGKYALALAPFAVMIGAIAHSFDHSAKKSKLAAENFREIKNYQMSIINQRRENCEKAKIAMAQKLNARNA